MRHYIICIFLFTAIGTQAQQINPVPDYVFRNQMSVGRNAVTDTAAYISIGPRYGANKGLMPPIVSDTAAITGVKRNGLLIFSVQRNNFQYWDSINSRWTSVTANVDTTVISTRAWRKKGDDSLGAVIATRTDTTLLSTRAWRQKGLDSLAAIEIDGSGTVNYVPKFTATRTLGNSQIFDNGTSVSVGTLGSGTNTVNILAGASGNTSSLVINSASAASDIFLRVDGVSQAIFKGGSSFTQLGSQQATPLDLLTSNVTRVRLFANGRVGVNTTTDAGYQFDVAGSMRNTTGAAFATSSGNVGIGTTNAQAQLHALTSTGTTVSAGDLGVNYAIIQGASRTGTTSVGGSFVNTLVLASHDDAIAAGTGASLGFQAKWNSAQYSSSALFASIFGGKENSTDANLAGYLSFATRVAGGNPTERMRITSAGNVGIGTTSPSEALHVVGRGRFTTIDSTSSPINVLTSDVNGVIRKTAPGVQGSGTTNYVAKFTASGTVGNSVLFESSSNILLNTTTNLGSYRLQVNHNAGDAMALVNEQTTGSTQNVSLRLATHDGSSVTVGSYLVELSGSWNSSNFTGGNYPGSTALQNTRANGLSLIASNASGNIRFYTGGENGSAEKMRLNQGGELLINTTTDAGDYRLQVNGNANFRDDVLIDTNLRVNRHISLDQTPKAWALGNAIEGPQGSTLFVAGGGVQTLANVYYDGSYKYSTSNPGAAMFLLQSGITFATYGSGTANGALTGANEMVYAGGELRVGIADQGTFKLQVADKSYFGDEVQIASTTDLGNYKLQVTGEAIITAGIRTDAPSGGTAATWKLGTVATVSPTSPNRTIEVEIGGTTYYIHAKTTND